MSSHQELIQLAEMKALGALDPHEQALLEPHLSGGCGACEAVMRSAAAVTDELALAIEPMDVSPEVRTRLMRQVRSELERQPAVSIHWHRYALAASLIGMLVLGAALFRVSQELGQERIARAEAVRSYQSERTESERTFAKLDAESRERARIERELESLRGTVQALTAASTETIPLAGRGPTPEASARAYLDPESRRLILYVYDLPEAPAGRSYQLWVIAGGHATSAGILELGPQGEARHDTVAESALSGGVTIAVTLEPEGGRDQPSGPVVLAGK